MQDSLKSHTLNLLKDDQLVLANNIIPKRLWSYMMNSKMPPAMMSL